MFEEAVDGVSGGACVVGEVSEMSDGGDAAVLENDEARVRRRSADVPMHECRDRRGSTPSEETFFMRCREIFETRGDVATGGGLGFVDENHQRQAALELSDYFAFGRQHQQTPLSLA